MNFQPQLLMSNYKYFLNFRLYRRRYGEVRRLTDVTLVLVKILRHVLRNAVKRKNYTQTPCHYVSDLLIVISKYNLYTSERFRKYYLISRVAVVLGEVSGVVRQRTSVLNLHLRKLIQLVAKTLYSKERFCYNISF
jgi:hypothetical protein